jgi:predicted dehydrogenase
MAPAYRDLGLEVDVVSSRDGAAVEAACRTADLVSIHSPPFQHREHVLMAIGAGCAVLCDKPFGRNAAEAREMRDAAHEAGVLHFLNFELRAQPAWAHARRLLADGRIGTLEHISWTNFGSGMRGRPHGWLYDAELAGGWIGAYGSHVIDALRFFFGSEIGNGGGLVRTEIRSRRDQGGDMIASSAEDSFSCWFAMAGGGSASIDTGYATAVNLPPVTYLLGSEAAISIEGDARLSVIRPDGSAQIDLSEQTRGLGFAAVSIWLKQVASALDSGQQIAPNFDDGLAVAIAMEQLKSAVIRAG